MQPSRKPGIVSFIVVTLLAILVLWAAFESPRDVFPVLAAVFLWYVWFSGWRRHRKLAGQIAELSAELAATREEARAQSAAAQVQPAGTPPVAAAAAAAVTAAPAPTTPAYQPAAAVPPPPPMPPAQAAANLTFAQVETAAQPAGPGLFERLRSLPKFEELLGTNLFAKIGAVLIVLGVAYALSVVWKSDVGPGVRVAMGVFLGAALLGAGMFFERKERYRVVARAAVAAGWAILFATAYAMNHVDKAKVLPSEVGDLVLMFGVATGMVAHTTLRYRSQVATGLAFLSAFAGIFATVFPSKEVAAPDVSSLTAAIVLAAGVAVVAVLRQWFVLETCAIVATYLNHFVWLIHIIQPMGKHHKPFPEFLSSAGILVSYWAVYRVSYLWRQKGDERISAAAALLNTGLLLAVLKYQAVHPEYAFWALLALGSIELVLGQIPRAKQRSMPHIVLTVIGACLLMAAIPFRAGLRTEIVSLIWLAEAEAFFLVGVLTQEKVFRRVGLFAFVPLAGQIISTEAARVYGMRMEEADVHGRAGAAGISVLVALVLYANVHWAPRRWAAQFESNVEKNATRDLSYAAALLAFVAGWMACPLLGAAVCWMALACALAWVARRLDLKPLRVQSLLLAAFAFLRVLIINLPSDSKYHVGARQWPARLITVAAIVVLGYLAAYWHRAKNEHAFWVRWLEPGFSWAASTMLTLLLWYELSSASVVLGWGLFALLAFEAGMRRNNVQLRLQAYVAGVCTFLRLPFVNLNAISAERLSPRLYTIVPLAALFFCLYSRVDEEQQAGSLSSAERKFKAAEIFAWLGTVTIVLMLRFEPPLDWVAAAWAAAAFVLMALAWWAQKRVLAHQAMLLSLGVLFRGVLHNLYERSYFTPPRPALAYLSTVSAVALLFASLFFAFKLRRQIEEGDKRNWLVRGARLLDARPEQVLFFAPLILLTAFLAVELPSGRVTAVWGTEAVVVFVIALWIGERSYRLSAMGLLLLCLGKVVIVDFWHMGRGDKAVTFIVLGALLLGVPILYSKNREKVRQYL